MSQLQSKSVVQTIFLLGICLSLTSWWSVPVQGYTHLEVGASFPNSSSQTYVAKWNLSLYANGIPYVLKTDAMGDGTTDILSYTEFDLIRNGFSNWEKVSSTAIKFQQIGTSSQHVPGKLDGVNVIGFNSDDPLARAGVLGLTLNTVRVVASGSYAAGNLVESDIILFDSDKIQWTASNASQVNMTAGAVQRISLDEVITREIGTFCGLGPSQVRSPFEKPVVTLQNGVVIQDNRCGAFNLTALMYPFVLNNSPVNGYPPNGNPVGYDDAAGMTVLYPKPTYANQFGSISGKVNFYDAGSNQKKLLAGAHVVAVQRFTQIPYAGTLSKVDGSWRIEGLPVGDYFIWVEPSSPFDYQGLGITLDPDAADFIPVFYNQVLFQNQDQAQVVSVRPGAETSNILLDVTKTIPNREVQYASGDQVDANGQPLVLKVEPDNNFNQSTYLNDLTGDGFYDAPFGTYVNRITDNIQSIGDKDFYWFRAYRDDVIQIRVASVVPSLLMPLVNVYGPGQQAVPFDSATAPLGATATITFVVPATNRYFIEVTDQLGGGSAFHNYILTVQKLSGRVPISPLSRPTSVLDIPISDADLVAPFVPPYGRVELAELRVQFLDPNGTGGLNTSGSDFLPPTRNPNAEEWLIDSGFSLFLDNGTSYGVFDYDQDFPQPGVMDQPVKLKEPPVIIPLANGFEVRFVPETPLIIPAQLRQDKVADLHVVVKTSLTLHHGDEFVAIVPANGISLKIYTPPPAITSISTTLFAGNFPNIFNRNLFTGDIVELTSFISPVGQIIDARSNDFPIIGLDLLGDPSEQYWISQVEVSFVGLSLHNVIQFYQPWFAERWASVIPNLGLDPSNQFKTFEPTDLLPLSSGDDVSGGVNLYLDQDNRSSDPGNGVPNFGIGADYLLPLYPHKRYETYSIDNIAPEILYDMLPYSFLPHQLDVDPPVGSVLLKNLKNMKVTAFKAVLPLRLNSALQVPSQSGDGYLGPDMFVSIRTSVTALARDMFVPYIQLDGIHVKNNLSQCILFQDPGQATTNLPSLRRIDPTTIPNTTNIEVRPNPTFVLKDMVNPEDPSNRGSLIGTVDRGSPPLAVVGIDAQDFDMCALITPNAYDARPSGEDLLNTGVVLNSLTVILDPLGTPDILPLDFIRDVPVQSEYDYNLIGASLRGVEIYVDDDTPAGDLTDNDSDGLTDEELLNGEDDDLDGLTDEEDFGDEDGVGLNGQFDPRDDTLAYLQNHDLLRTSLTHPWTSLVGTPTVTQNPGGSLTVSFPDLTTLVSGERALSDFDLLVDPLSGPVFPLFFVRTDHRVLTDNPASPSVVLGGASFAGQPGGTLPIGFLAEDVDALLSDDVAGLAYDYYYLTQIPNNNTKSFLQGPDFFVTLRMGAGAQRGDQFSLRIPQGGITYSLYRNPIPVLQNISPGSYPVGSFSTHPVRVGTDNAPPTLTFIAPAVGTNLAVPKLENNQTEYEYTVRFNFTDVDNVASVDFYYDDNNFGADGKPIPFISDNPTTNIEDNDGQNPMEFIFRFPPDLANDPEAKVFIYAIMTDDVNPPVILYAPGPITLDTSNRQSLALEEYLLTDNFGRIFGTLGANVNIPDYPNFSNPRKFIRDLELTPSKRGAVFLQGFGEVSMTGDPGPWRDYIRLSRFLKFPSTPQNPLGNLINTGFDIYRDIELHFKKGTTDDHGYYALTEGGEVIPVGLGDPTLRGLLPTTTGFSMARDMELTSTGKGLVVLNGDGRTTTIGEGPRISGPNLGFDIARDLALTPTGNGFYILTGYGDVIPLGDARPFTYGHAVVSTDQYRSVEVVPGNTGLLIMDREGQVFVDGEARVGPNPIAPGVVPAFAGGNVVLDEVGGALIDMEVVGLGQLATTFLDVIGCSDTTQLDTLNLCDAIRNEDLDGLIKFFDPAFKDRQGHTLQDLTTNWRSFFDYFEVLGCRIPCASVTVSTSPQVPDGVVLTASMEIMVMNPNLYLMSPGDDPTTREEEEQTPIFGPDAVGEQFTIGPIPFDQVARFWEADDGRGWTLNVWDDDHVEGQIDRADKMMTQRVYTKARNRTRREGEGLLFLEEEDGPGNTSRNSEYIFQFIEMQEANSGDPRGGWNAPLVYLQYFNEIESDEGGRTLPTSIFVFPVTMEMVIDPLLNIPKIRGGSSIVWSLLPARTADQFEYEQNGGADDEIERPTGWRFFNPLGIFADANIPRFYDSHLFFTDDGVLTVPDLSSSASLVDLTALNDALPTLFPVNTIPLKDDLFLAKQAVIDSINFSQFVGEVDAVVGHDYLITFRGDEQGGVTDRLYYATFRIIAINAAGANNISDALAMIWRFDPVNDYLPYRPLK